MLGHPHRYFKVKGEVRVIVDVSWVSLGEAGIASGTGSYIIGRCQERNSQLDSSEALVSFCSNVECSSFASDIG